MAVGNGDERRAAAWERVEAKLDRVAERVDRIEDRLDRIEDRLDRIEDRLDRVEARLDRLERLAETAELRLKRLEDNGELIRLLIEAVRHEVDNKIEKAKEELLSGLGREMRVELLAAQTLNDERVAKLERRVDALEAARA